jgi:hypothetical protein
LSYRTNWLLYNANVFLDAVLRKRTHLGQPLQQEREITPGNFSKGQSCVFFSCFMPSAKCSVSFFLSEYLIPCILQIAWEDILGQGGQ